jgi:hypothetical protein
MNEALLRSQLRNAVTWGDARVTFEKALAGLPVRLRGAVPPGLPYSIWQLVEHIRIAQADILEFCVSRRYKPKKWPDAYWPKSAAPRNAAAWRSSVTAFRRDRRELQRLAATTDLTARVPNGDGQTYLREVLLVLDHTAYHVGQIVLVRRALGTWSD